MSEVFNGWSPAALEFYRGLEADNSRTYWVDHKRVYDDEVLAPMNLLLDDLLDEFGESKVFRPNRDIRFSNDKSPYKTAIGATLRNGGYVHLSSRGLGVGAGYHTMMPDQLERYRVAVADDSTETLRTAIAAVESHGISVSGGDDALKSAPRGYSKNHPREDLLRYKSLTAWKRWPIADWLYTADAETHVVETLRAARPLSEWLAHRVGPSSSLR